MTAQFYTKPRLRGIDGRVLLYIFYKVRNVAFEVLAFF